MAEPRLVARHREREQIEAALARATRGEPCGLVIEGPAGMGKSTLLGWTRERALELGFVLVGARAEELEQGRAFGPLIAAVRRAVSPPRPPLVDDALDSLVGGGEFAAVDALGDWLESIAAKAPTLLWIDDLQWADIWTARAVAVLARRLSTSYLVLVAALRPTPRSDEVAAAVRRLTETGNHLRVGPLSEAEVAEVVEALAGRPPGPALMNYLSRAGGSPFYVTEIHRALQQDGALVNSGRVVEASGQDVPPSLLVTTMHRLLGHRPTELEVLRAAAVIGGRASIADLALATDEPLDAVVEAVADLRSAGLLIDDDEGAFRLSHDLVREAIYQDLGAGVRGTLHRRVGMSLADQGRVAEAAVHLLIGAAPGDQAASEVLVTAAQSASVPIPDRFKFVETALRLWPGHPRSVELRHWAARLPLYADQPALATPRLRALLAETDDAGDRLHLVEALAVVALVTGDVKEGAR